MISIIVNILIVIVFYIATKHRNNVFTISLLGMYIFILLGAIGCIHYGLYKWPVGFINITLFSILYFICISPFYIYSKKLDASNLILPSSRKLDIFACFYILVSVIYIYLSFKIAINNYVNGDYLTVYEDMRHGNLEKFSSFTEKYSYYIVYHFQYVALIVGFIYYIKNSFWKGSILIIASSIAMLLYAIVIVSRTDLFQVVLMLGICMFFFKNSIPKKTYKKLIGALSIVGFLFVVLAILISASRAAFKSDNTWIFNYFGRSILTFNSFLDYMRHAAEDQTFFFDSEASFHILHPSYSGNEFLALFTRLYSDFDFFGFLLCIIPLILFPKNRKITISGLFVILLIYRIVILGLMYSSFQFIPSMCFFIVYIVTLLWFNSKYYKKTIKTAKTISHLKTDNL